MRKMCVAVFAALSVLAWQGQALANPAEPGAETQDQATRGTVEPPGYADFENGNPSPEDIREQQEREEDRNIISPNMQDGEPLPGMNADAP